MPSTQYVILQLSASRLGGWRALYSSSSVPWMREKAKSSSCTLQANVEPSSCYGARCICNCNYSCTHHILPIDAALLHTATSLPTEHNPDGTTSMTLEYLAISSTSAPREQHRTEARQNECFVYLKVFAVFGCWIHCSTLLFFAV